MKICVPIREKSQKKAILKAKIARRKGADMVEIWLDSLRDLNTPELLKKIPRPIIVTCKTKKEGGAFRGSDNNRIEILKEVSNYSDYIDLDLQLAKKTYRRGRERRKVIISYHNFKKTESLQKLLQIAKQAFSLGADTIKIATTVKNYPDNVILFELMSQLKQMDKKAIVIGMGAKGKLSRIGCLILGGYLTYAALDANSRTAEGQMTLQDYKKLMKI